MHSNRRGDALMTVTCDIPDELFSEFQTQADKVKMTLHGYVAEVLEAHAAERRLPKVPLSLRGSGGESSRNQFPWPAETYRMHLPRRGNAG
jgi:hypothetical protein